jgi:hypothetical protein
MYIKNVFTGAPPLRGVSYRRPNCINVQTRMDSARIVFYYYYQGSDLKAI